MLAFTSIGVIVTFVILLVIVIVSIVLYKKIYQRNINRALDGENRSSLSEPSQFLVGLSFVVLIVLSVISMIKISDLETTILNQQNTIQSIYYDIRDARSEIEELQDDFDAYVESQKMVKKASYIATEIIDDQIKVNLTIELNEKETGANISLVVRNEDVENIYLLTSNSLVYTYTILLDDQETYDFYLLSEGEIIEQEYLFEIEVENSFSGRFSFDSSGFWNSQESFSEWEVHIGNKLDVSSALFIDTVVVEVYKNDNLVETINTDAYQDLIDSSYQYVNMDLRIEDFSESDVISIDITLTDASGNAYIETFVIYEEELNLE